MTNSTTQRLFLIVKLPSSFNLIIVEVILLFNDAAERLPNQELTNTKVKSSLSHNELKKGRTKPWTSYRK